jgi:hypothetical protein
LLLLLLRYRCIVEAAAWRSSFVNLAMASPAHFGALRRIAAHFGALRRISAHFGAFWGNWRIRRITAHFGAFNVKMRHNVPTTDLSPMPRIERFCQ